MKALNCPGQDPMFRIASEKHNTLGQLFVSNAYKLLHFEPPGNVLGQRTSLLEPQSHCTSFMLGKRLGKGLKSSVPTTGMIEDTVIHHKPWNRRHASRGAMVGGMHQRLRLDSRQAWSTETTSNNIKCSDLD